MYTLSSQVRNLHESVAERCRSRDGWWLLHMKGGIGLHILPWDCSSGYLCWSPSDWVIHCPSFLGFLRKQLSVSFDSTWLGCTFHTSKYFHSEFIPSFLSLLSKCLFYLLVLFLCFFQTRITLLLLGIQRFIRRPHNYPLCFGGQLKGKKRVLSVRQGTLEMWITKKARKNQG